MDLREEGGEALEQVTGGTYEVIRTDLPGGNGGAGIGWTRQTEENPNGFEVQNARKYDVYYGVVSEDGMEL